MSHQNTWVLTTIPGPYDINSTLTAPWDDWWAHPPRERTWDGLHISPIKPLLPGEKRDLQFIPSNIMKPLNEDLDGYYGTDKINKINSFLQREQVQRYHQTRDHLGKWIRRFTTMHWARADTSQKHHFQLPRVTKKLWLKDNSKHPCLLGAQHLLQESMVLICGCSCFTNNNPRGTKKPHGSA